MPLAHYHDMVKAFPPNRANHALRIGVLPRRAWRNDRLPNVQQPGLTRKSFAIDLIPVRIICRGLSSCPHLFVFVVLAHHRRRVLHFNVTEHPTAAWTTQQIVDAFPDDSAPSYLLRDRDSVYGHVFRQRLKGMGVGEVLTAPTHRGDPAGRRTSPPLSARRLRPEGLRQPRWSGDAGRPVAFRPPSVFLTPPFPRRRPATPVRPTR